MHTFAIVSRIDHLPRLLSDLAGLRQVQRTRTSVGDLMLNGIWIEHRPDAAPGAVSAVRDWLSSGVLQVATPLELSGIWALCRPEQPGVSRRTLLDTIVDAVRWRGLPVEGRFIPVFHQHESLQHRHAEWEALAARHPGVVMPPLEQSSRGVITFIDFDQAGVRAPHRTDGPRRRPTEMVTPPVSIFRRPLLRRSALARAPRSLG